MEINPYESRLRMLQQIDGVQMQREAAPDEETAGCPGCPFFWTCPVPHRGEEVRAPQEIEIDDVRGELGARRAFRPRDSSDIGWTDVWIDDDGNRIDPEQVLRHGDEAGGPPDQGTGPDDEPHTDHEEPERPEQGETAERDPRPAPRASAPSPSGRRRGSRRRLFPWRR